MIGLAGVLVLLSLSINGYEKKFLFRSSPGVGAGVAVGRPKRRLSVVQSHQISAAGTKNILDIVLQMLH